MSKFGTKNALFWYFWARILKKLLPYLKSVPSNLSHCKILQKNPKIFKFETKNALFWYFWARILKTYCHIWNQCPRICLIAKYRKKTKMPKFGAKNALFGYFWARIWKKLLSYLKLAPSNLSKWKISQQKLGCLNLGAKMPYLGIFELEFQNTIVIFEISTLQFV